MVSAAMPSRSSRAGLVLRAVGCLLALAAVAPALRAQDAAGAAAPGLPDAGSAAIARGWATLRAFDCARCHGRDLRGWSAPDLVAAVREGPRERFDRYVLGGDVLRGMPGYRSQAAVVAELDAIYAYLRARAEGRVGPGAPEAQAVSAR
jgi:mono/diheme cytochrome c family protein